MREGEYSLPSTNGGGIVRGVRGRIISEREHALSRRRISCAARRCVSFVGLLLSYYFFLRPQLRKWGTRLGESQRRLPGDEIIPNPTFETTHAVNIDAPPEAVWPWIAQMGRGLTGYYALDLLLNQGVPSVDFLRQDLAAPAVDQAMDGGFRILNVVPGRMLLFGGFNLKLPLGAAQDVTYLYLLERRRDGRTRLLVRRRGYCYSALGMVCTLLLEIVHFAFIFPQLKRLKAYSEAQPRRWASD